MTNDELLAGLLAEAERHAARLRRSALGRNLLADEARLLGEKALGELLGVTPTQAPVAA